MGKQSNKLKIEDAGRATSNAKGRRRKMKKAGEVQTRGLSATLSGIKRPSERVALFCFLRKLFDSSKTNFFTARNFRRKSGE